MKVNEIRDRIVALSHQSAGDGEVQAKALGWLNAAYHEVMDEVVPYLPGALQRQESVVTAASGQALLAVAPYRVLAVRDEAAGRMLAAATPAQALAGACGDYVVTASGVKLEPARENVRLVVLSIPVAADLVEGGSEESVVLPRAYHYALVWGGLMWSALFERGFGTQGELLVYQRQWAEAKERIKLGLLHNMGTGLRVQPFVMV